jgi:hypothetical protein
LVIAGASVAASLVTGGRWTAEELDAALTMDRFVTPPRIADFVDGL